MNKRQRLRHKQHVAEQLEKNAASEAARVAEYKAATLMLGGFSVPAFDAPAVAFGATIGQYPDRKTIPEVPRRYHDVVSSLFFKGGTLEVYGLRLKASVHKARAMAAIRAWLGSWAPKHEHKTETVAWALSEWCEDIP
jgi:hypothetical protein